MNLGQPAVSKKTGILGRIGSDLTLWLLAAVFLCLGLMLTASSGKVMLTDLRWKDAITTTGRVIITEWQHERQDNRLKITYRYKDDGNVIYHSTGVVARKLGKVNLKPGAPIVVLFQKADHSQSLLNMELNSAECLPLLIIGLVEVLVGAFFLFVCFRRFKSKRLVLTP